MKKNFKIFLGISLLSLGTIGIAPILTSCADWSYGDVKISEDVLTNSNNISRDDLPTWVEPNQNNTNNTISTPSNPKPIYPEVAKKPTIEEIRNNPRKYHVTDMPVDSYLDQSIGWKQSFDYKLKIQNDEKDMKTWLEQFNNTNYKVIIDDDKEEIYSVWPKSMVGIKNWSEVKTQEIKTQDRVKSYITPNTKNGLFNTSKDALNPEDNFDCMSGVQTNWIFWWLYANKDKLKTWLDNNPKEGFALDNDNIRNLKYTNDWHNTIFNDYMLKKLPKRYVNYDTKLLKWFFMGDARLQTGGYLRGLWNNYKNEIKKASSISVKNIDELNKALTWNALKGNAGSLSFSWGGIGSHIINIYGVDFDINKNVKAFWVADSDAATYEHSQTRHPPQIKRMMVDQKNNKVYLKNKLREAEVEIVGTYGSFAWDQNIWSAKK